MSRDPNAATAPRVNAVLFDTRAPDREIEAEELGVLAPGAEQLLWVDVEGTEVASAMTAVLSLADRLGLQDAERAVREALDGKPRLRNHDDWFLVQAMAVGMANETHVRGVPMLLLCGRNTVLTAHLGPLEFLQELRVREQADSRIGALGAESFSVSLLGWLLEGYLDAVSGFESEVDHL